MVISCSELLEDLSSLQDGELDEGRRSAVTAHLVECGRCQSAQRGIQGLSSLFVSANSAVQAGAPDLWESISGKLPTVCELIREDLSAYLDGELVASAKEGVSQHLEQCGACLSQFQDLSRVNSLLSKGLELPGDIEIDIWSQVQARINEDCVLIKNELSAYIDKEVPTLRHRSITAHLLECVDCKSDFVKLSDFGDALRNHYQVELPEDFDLWPAIKENMKVVPLSNREKHRSVASKRKLYAVAAAMFAGILASLSLYLSVNGGSTQVTPVTAEAYLIDSSLGEPSDVAEAVVYEH